MGSVVRRLTRWVAADSLPPDLADGDTMKSCLERLAADGFELTRAVDIGACRGEWTQMLRMVYPHASVLMIEPQTRHEALLAEYVDASDAPTTFEPLLVGAQQRSEIPFHVLDDAYGGTGSSVMRELSNVSGHVEARVMETMRSVIEATSFGTPQLVKLDVQGYELQVLEGFGDVLAEIDFLLLEIAVTPYNEGAPLMAEVIEWLDQRGFVTHDLAGDTRLPDGRLAQIDLLFANQRLECTRPRRVRF